MTTTKSFAWDPDEVADVAEALDEYRQAIASGYAVYKVTDGGKRKQVHRFTNSGELLFVPALQGG